MRLGWAMRELAYTRERSALALLGLSCFCVLYGAIALRPPPELLPWRGAFGGLAACYVTAFLALASGWFWARWFVAGLAWSGAMVGIAGVVMMGWQPALVFYGGIHGATALLLAGPKMAQAYEGQSEWRQRYGVDEFGVARVGKYVSRSAAALPSFILWLLAPRDHSLVGPACFVLLVLGGGAVLRGRSWGLFATAGAVAGLGLSGMITAAGPRSFVGWAHLLDCAAGSFGAVAAALLLAAAIAPFVIPAVRYFRSLPR
jgi:hypothetical protein